MLNVTYALLIAVAGLLGVAAAILVIDGWTAARLGQTPAFRWRLAGRFAAMALVLLLPALSIVVVPGGAAAVRTSQWSGAVKGPLFAGTHVIIPFAQSVDIYSVRDQVYTTIPTEAAKDPTPVLKVHSKEGLPVGLGVTVRYQLDPQRLPYIQSSLPRPVETEILPPVVANAFRQTISGYLVRDVFSTRREEVRRTAAEAITRRLLGDGIVVKEVMLRDVALPPEYAKGLEGLLLKAQENDRLGIELDVKQKLVRAAELEAEAAKVRQVKQAEGRAQTVVLEAKAQADAMQHTLPLKEKQIQQSRLEAEARKEATVKNAEAAAQAKVIDSKAELEKRNLLSQAEAQRIHLLAAADAERMTSEARVLKDNPLLIQKIIAERLSDKVQIMMVPMDGKFFFTNDVLKTTPVGGIAVPHPER
jgi:regulator of protease activity HflC (stomatin/prohibitin superfamily)